MKDKYIQRHGGGKWHSVFRYLLVRKYFCLTEVKEQMEDKHRAPAVSC